VCVFESFFVVETWDFILTQVKTVLNNLLEFWFHFSAEVGRSCILQFWFPGSQLLVDVVVLLLLKCEVWSVERRSIPENINQEQKQNTNTQKHKRKYIVMNSHRQLHAPEDLVVAL
jgi:hypothetical protein